MHEFKLLIFVVVAELTVSERFEQIDDTNFAIKWPGPLSVDEEVKIGDNTMVVKSSENEVYYCVLPEKVRMSMEEEIITYDGPTAYDLIQPLFDQTTCSYRIESFWTYELCHGKQLRQYHEEKEKIKLQEYMLGTFDRFQGSKDYAKVPDQKEIKEKLDIKSAKQVPVVKVEGLEFPYFQLNFTKGTPCDLTGTPRRAFLKYVCHQEGRGEIYEIKELATCEYQVIVLTYLLCSHPSYRQKTQPVNEIQCHSMEGAPSMPKSLQSLQYDKSPYDKQQQPEDWGYNTEVPPRKVGIKININGDIVEKEINVEQEYEEVYEEEAKVDVTNYQPTDTARTVHPKAEGLTRTSTTISSNTDMQLIKDLLRGEYCLTGGGGWWKYEFCFGKRAVQFHEDQQSGTKTVILLGKWDEAAHLKWIKENPAKKPKLKGDKATKTISNMYIQGDICDLTKKPRFVEVKLKCKENPSQPHSVAIYLVEPYTCEYVLVIESPLLCSVVAQADENGLIDVPKVLKHLQTP